MTEAIAPNPNITIMQWQDCDTRWQASCRRVSRGTPEALVIPHNQMALSQVVQEAQQNNKRLIPCGNGTKLAWGGLAKQVDWLVSTQKLNRIVEHAVGDLTITVEAGLTLKKLQAHLAQYRQFLPVDPAFPESATIGGIVATGDSGSWRQQYGGVRELLLGIKVIRADGEFAKAGGQVVKNVAGYDLMKLLTGSYGSLAIATELTFRLYAKQQLTKTVLITSNHTQITAVQTKLFNSVLVPSRADLLSPALSKKLDLGDKFSLVVRFASVPESVQAQLEILTAIATQHNLTITPQAETIWDDLTQILDPQPVYCKVGLLPHQATNFLEQVEQSTQGQAIARIHTKSGLGIVAFPHGKFLRQFRELRQFCQQHQGFLTMLDAPLNTKAQFEPWGYHGDALPLMRNIKEQFDPHNLLSPGRFVGGI